jgi:hypothetical protein
MDTRTLRFAAVAVVVALGVGTKVTTSRGAKGDQGIQHELTPEVRAAGLTFAPNVTPADQQWVREAIAQARPEAQKLIDAVDGLVTISTANMPGTPWVGMAQEGSDDIQLNIAYLDGQRKQDRSTAVLHELGHVIDFELVPDDQMQQLAGAIPSGGGGCLTAETGDCTAPEERFADTFAIGARRRLRRHVAGVAGDLGAAARAARRAAVRQRLTRTFLLTVVVFPPWVRRTVAV